MATEDQVYELSVSDSRTDADFQEMMECARYGECEDFLALLDKLPGEACVRGDCSGNTVLHFAGANGHLDICRHILLRSSECVNVPNGSGNTPLHWASLTGQLEVVKLLLEHGADLRAENKMKETPVCLSEQGGHAHVHSFLTEILISSLNEDAEEEVEVVGH